MSMKAAMPITYTIALIFGIVILSVLGYWFATQSTKVVGVGGVTECQARQQSYCQQWKIVGFSQSLKPPISFPEGCATPLSMECSRLLNCRYNVPTACNEKTEDTYMVEGIRICCPKS